MKKGSKAPKSAPIGHVKVKGKGQKGSKVSVDKFLGSFEADGNCLGKK